MSDTSVDWGIAVVGVALLAVPAAVLGVVGAVGYGLFKAAEAAYHALQGPPPRPALRAVHDERDQAIAEIVRIREDAVRQMASAADDNVLEGGWEEL